MKYRVSRLAMTACALMAAGIVHGQTTLKMDGVWRGSLGAGVSITDGNSRSSSINVNAEAVRLTERDKTRIYGTALYGKTNGAESANLLRAGGRYDHDLTPKIFGFGGIDFERDKIGNIELRVAPGVGLGYHVIKNAANTFDVFGGIGYVNDNYFRPVLVGGSVRSSYGRAELILGEESTHKLSETTALRQRLVVYPNLDKSGEYRAVFDSGLSVAMSSRMSLNVGLINRYNSDPGPGVKKNDLLFVTGIGVKID